jgi:hypothetical protein
MEEARGIAFRMIRPGVACGELDSAVNLTIRGWRPRARLIGALTRQALRWNEKAGRARESRYQAS